MTDPGTFTCDCCGKEFRKKRTDAEAIGEFLNDPRFDDDDSEMVIVCEDCYEKVMGGPADAQSP